MGRTIIIGDIHGCLDELNDLLDAVGLQDDDRVIAVGDLIVKGPNNSGVLDRFISDERFSSVIGNQDRVLRQHWRGEPVRLTKAQKAAAAELAENRESYSTFLRSLPYTIDLGSHLVVHAGVRPGVPLSNQTASDLTEIRTMGANPSSRRGVPWYDVYQGEQVVLFGHWPAAEPRRAAKAIGLDTGCVYGGRLTAYLVETAEIFSIPAHRAYDPPTRGLRRFRKSSAQSSIS